MGGGPIGILTIMISVMVFQALIFGSTLAAESFPTLFTPNFGGCAPPPAQVWIPIIGPVVALFTGQVTNTIDYLACLAGNTLLVIINVILFIGGAIVFFIHLISFDIPGAPWWIRTIMSVAITGSALWSIVALIRGTKA